MIQIQVPLKLADEDFESLSAKWSTARNVCIALPSNMGSKEAGALARYLLSRLPNDLAFSILADLVETKTDLPAGLLRQIFKRGDVACKVAVCSREGLSLALQKLCWDSEDPNVIEHMRARNLRGSFKGMRACRVSARK
jgi:hypothetical protein